MVKALICTLGFDTDPVVRRIVGSRLEEGGILLLLTAEPLRPETESAINDIKGLVDKAYLGSVKVEVKAINPRNFHEAVSTIRKELERFKHDEVVLNLSGGMRALVLSAYTAYLIAGLKKAKLIVDLEARQGTVELPPIASLLTTPPQLTEEKLGTASKELVAFQEQNKAVSLEEQTEAAIKEAGELKGNIIAKEVELGVALQSLKPDHISIIKLRKELEELNKQYNYLQYGDDNNPEKQKEFYIPFSNVPEIGLELARLTRNVKVQETVWELLNQQYYHAKIQEARDTPTIEVLDIAVVPETRSKPKRKLLVLVGGFLAIMFNIFWVFAKDFYEKLKSDPTSSHKTNNIVNSLKSDFFSGKNFFTNIQNRFKRNKNQH